MSTERSEGWSVGAKRAPIIFLGMHRSGTSMLTGFLNWIGLETGWSLDHDEAVFFQKLNIYIERVCNCGWDNPEPIGWLSTCPQSRDKLLRHLKEQVTSQRAALFFGWPKAITRRSITKLDQPWGWKDPRNTFTADLWRELFPGTRFVHIYRNGVDVAASLRERELKHPPRPDSVYSSVRCCRLDGGFALWEQYIEKGFSLLPDGGENDILHLRYEDFLKDPMPMLERLTEFCGLQADRSVLAETASRADISRAYGFRRDPELLEFYARVSHTPWMQRLGYHDLSPL